MTKYRSFEEQHRHYASDRFLHERFDHYMLRPYPKNYDRPLKAARKASKPRYSHPQYSRGGRGRSHSPKPNYFESQKPEKKYEPVMNHEKISSSLVEKNSRYRLESDGMRTLVDTEQVTKEVERRLEGKLSEELLEKFGAELEELMKRIEKTSESSEQRTDKRQEVERHVERDQGQRVDVETERLESDGGSPELAEGSKEDNVSLEGGFVVSKPFGLAIPIEADEKKIEDVEAENQVESEVETETKNETTETENAEGETETKSLEDTEAKEESSEEIEKIIAQTEEPVENTEDIEVKDSSDPGETGEVVPEEAIEPEVATEPLPEEAELYPVEEEPTETV